MALAAHHLVEWYHDFLIEQINEFGFSVGQLIAFFDFKDGADKDARIFAFKSCLTPSGDHVQEHWDQSRIGVQFNIRGEYVMRIGRFTS